MLRLVHWSPAGRRWYHSHHITDHMQFITKHNDKITVDPKTFSITRRVRKPICVQLNWMSAAAAQTQRYTKMVLDEGLDAVSVRCEVRDVLLPETGVQRIARELLKLMLANDTTYLVYGLSIGSYLWSEAMVHATKEAQYQPVLDRVDAQIFDSLGELMRIPTGIPFALFPNLVKNKQAFRWVRYICDAWYGFYLRSCYSSVTVHYERAAHAFLHTTCRAPALVMHAKNDEIATWENARSIHDAWKESGIKTSWKCWDRSDHVANYLYHPQEYKTLIQTHLQQNVPGLIRI